jgi:hypothetical protein
VPKENSQSLKSIFIVVYCLRVFEALIFIDEKQEQTAKKTTSPDCGADKGI